MTNLGGIKTIQKMSGIFSRLSALFVIGLVLITFEQVVARYLFSASSVGLQELEWHLFGMVFLLAAASAMEHDEHVRVDIIYSKLSPPKRALINILGIILFVFPATILIIYHGYLFADRARLIGETSPDSGGLSHRWIIKAMIPFGASLLFLQSLSTLTTNWAILSQRSKSEPLSQ